MPERTPSQTVGPYLHIGLVPGAYGVREVFSPVVADAGIPGTHIRIEGRILDGEGNVAPDAMVEMERACNLSEGIIRVLITRADHLTIDEMKAADDPKGLEAEAKLRATQPAMAALAEPTPVPTVPDELDEEL